MVVIQDFEAITPNNLCRVIETVSGSGIIIVLFGSMTLLQNMYSINMDVHNKYKTSMFNVI
jgi:N-acetyltransferase 10